MTQTYQAGTFTAKLIPKHLIGADYCYDVYNRNTNLKIGMIEGETGDFRPSAFGDYTIGIRQLRELSNLCYLIKTALNH